MATDPVARQAEILAAAERKRVRIVDALRRAVAMGIEAPPAGQSYEGRAHYNACWRIVEREDDPAAPGGRAEYNVVYRTADQALQWANMRRLQSPTGMFAKEAEEVFQDLAAALGTRMF